MTTFMRSATLAAALLACCACALAGNPYAPLTDFNAIVFGDATASSGSCQGSLAVGGNFYASSYSVGSGSLPDASKNSLVVGGDLNALWGWQVYNGNTKYGGKLTSSPTTTAPYTVSKAVNVIDFATTKSQTTAISSALSKLTTTGSQVFQWGGYTLTGTSSSLNIFNVDATNWKNATYRNITAPKGSTVLINISGTDASISGGLSLSGVDNSTVLYNYFQANNLTVSGISLEGSLLAPIANLTFNSGTINGTIAVGSLNESSGMFGNHAFKGSLPTTVPEPSTFAASLGLLGMIPLLSLRKKTQKAQ